MKRILGAVFCCVSLTASLVNAEPYNTFDIPGDFPGTFYIDFLGTEFLLGGSPSGALSTDSQILFNVAGPPTGDAWDIAVSPEQFQFIGFRPVSNFDTPVFGAGAGQGTFDAATGQWELDMPALFLVGEQAGTKVDLHFTTEDPNGSRMVLDPNDPDWGNLDIVASGQVESGSALTLAYDDALIDAILSRYPGSDLGGNDALQDTPYEFRIFGHDPALAAPEPGSLLLVATPLATLVAWRRRPSL
jgi:hypothetical protein